MSEPTYQERFALVVQAPFQRVVGSRLAFVYYYLLVTDAPDFNMDQPNESGGCQGMRLGFEVDEIELDWDFREACFRGEGVNCYLSARNQSEREECLQREAASEFPVLTRMDASSAKPWQTLIGERLLSVTVWGSQLSSGNNSPQAVILEFSSTLIAVAVGMSGTRGCTIGDGDEVLLFDSVQWFEQPRAEEATVHLQPIWAYPLRLTSSGHVTGI